VELHVLASDYVNSLIVCSVNLALQKRESYGVQFHHQEQTEGTNYRNLPIVISQGFNPCTAVILCGFSFRSLVAVYADNFEILVSCEGMWEIFENTIQA
jgi:hypothetical protein